METSIMEEREVLMVSPTGNPDPSLKLAHFLKPSFTSSIHDLQPPFHLLQPNPITKPSLNISFNGCKHPQNNWKNWVTHMHSKHQTLWKEVGIHNAILNSTYKINIDHDLLVSFADKWCCQTNSFVFPWGEVTITLEDIIFLGGYSVLGDSVFSPLENTQEIEALEELEIVRKVFIRSRSKKANHREWMSRFMHSESRVEHEAFLALWLSRFVFPKTTDSILSLVFPIAVRLARGTKVALAPAVLASLYRDFRMIKEKIIESRESNKASLLVVWSPIQLAQIWVFERFPTLNFQPNDIENGEPPFARWCECGTNKKMNYIRAVKELGSEDFSWCSYGLWPCKFYNVKEGWVLMDLGLDEELESFVRCLRVSELVGIDRSCIEQYLPHRVAMQFGLGQDIPGPVARANESAEIAWADYTRPIGDVGLYFPSRFFEPCVTTRYLNWWNCISGEDSTKKSSRSSMAPVPKGEKSDNLPLVLPGFSPRCSQVEVSSSSEEGKIVQGKLVGEQCKEVEQKKSDNVPLVRPGFSPRCPIIDVSSSSDEGQQENTKEVKNTSSGSIKPSVCPSIQKPSSTMADYEVYGKGNIFQSEKCKEVKNDMNKPKTEIKVTVPPGFPPDPKGKKSDNFPLVPPGFSPRCPIYESSSDEGQQIIAKKSSVSHPMQRPSSTMADQEAFEKRNIVQSEECKEVQKNVNMPETETEAKAEVNVPSSFPQARSHSDESSVRSSASSKGNNRSAEVENIDEIKESKKISGDISESEKEVVNQNTEHLEKENGESSSLHKSEILRSRFEGRISNLEKIFAYLKAAKLNRRLD